VKEAYNKLLSPMLFPQL